MRSVYPCIKAEVSRGSLDKKLKAVVLIVHFGQRGRVWETTGCALTSVRLFYCQLVYIAAEIVFHWLSVRIKNSAINVLFNSIFFGLFHTFCPTQSFVCSFAFHIILLISSPSLEILIHLLCRKSLLHILSLHWHFARLFLPSSVPPSVALHLSKQVYSTCLKSVGEFCVSGIFISSWAKFCSPSLRGTYSFRAAGFIYGRT